jgi:uncharacterized protein with GYD domain
LLRSTARLHPIRARRRGALPAKREALAMKYVLPGTLGPQWAGRHAERTEQAKAKLSELNIKLEGVYYAQGEVDFVDIDDAPSADALLAFSIWYVKQGFGKFRSRPAFDDAAMRAALAKS